MERTVLVRMAAMVDVSHGIRTKLALMHLKIRG
jgi:hypothetical protein